MNLQPAHSSFRGAIALTQPSREETIAHRLQYAYEGNPALRKIVKPEQFAKALRELPATLGKHARLSNMMIGLMDKPEGIEMAMMAILLHAKADGITRKHSSEPALEHSLRVAENSLMISQGLIEDPLRLARVAIKAMGHDLIEDFKTVFDEIKALFGDAIAHSIKTMTTPKTWQLAEEYYTITSDFFSAEEMRDGASVYIPKMKKNRPVDYLILKSRLKQRFKCDEAKQFGIDEIIIKGVDNADCFLSYNADLAADHMRIYYSTELSQGQRALNGIFMLPSAKAETNMEARTIYHERAIIPQLRKIAAATPDNGIVGGEQAYQTLENRLNVLYYKQLGDLKTNLSRALQLYKIRSLSVAMFTSFTGAVRQYANRKWDELSRTGASL